MEAKLEAKLGMALDDIAGQHKRPYRGRYRREGMGDERREYGPSKGRPPRTGPSAAPENDRRKVQVENLNYKTSWQDLKDHMRAAGTVERADVLTDREGKATGRG